MPGPFPSPAPSPASSIHAASSGGVQDLGVWAASLIGLVLCLTLSVLLAWAVVVALRWALRQDEEERWGRILRTLSEEDSVSEFRRELEDL